MILVREVRIAGPIPTKESKQSMTTSTRRKITAISTALVLFLSVATLGSSAGAATEETFTINAASLTVNDVGLPFPIGSSATLRGSLDGTNFSGTLEFSETQLTFPDLVNGTEGRVIIEAGRYAISGSLPGVLNLEALAIGFRIDDGSGGIENCRAKFDSFTIPLNATLNGDGELGLSASGFTIFPNTGCASGAVTAAGLPTSDTEIFMTGTPATTPIDPVTPAYTG